METINQERLTTPPPAITVKKRSLFLPTLIIILVGIMISIVIALLLPLPNQVTSPNPSPSANTVSSPSATPTDRKISEFGGSTDFVNFENQLNTLKTDAAKADLSESELTYPLLDMHVNFNKQN
ncbi:MAG: hypothetical protein AAB874_08005 [Patescibacteria group bacterium]